MNLTQSQLDQIGQLPLSEQEEILSLIEEFQEARTREGCRVSFIQFVKSMWPAFIDGEHHKIMADAFERVARGELKRLIVTMPPRHTKSEFAS